MDRALGLAADWSIPAIELRTVGGQMDLPAYLGAVYHVPAKLLYQLGDHSVRIVALDTSVKLADAGVIDRNVLLAHVPWAEAMGIHWLRVFDGGVVADRDTLYKAAENLAWWDTQRRAHGWHVNLLIETHDSLVSMEAIQRFLTLCPGAALLWDTHNTWRKNHESPADIWPVIREQVAHIHVKDSISRPSARHAFTYVLPGHGEFPMAALRTALAKDSYTGFISLEWERHWHSYLPPLDVALKAANDSGWW